LSKVKNIQYSEKKAQWLLNQQKIKTKKKYKIAINEYLMTGKETNLDFLNPQNPALKVLFKPSKNDSNDARTDIRKVFVKYLKLLPK
jgi:hypothetical protein